MDAAGSRQGQHLIHRARTRVDESRLLMRVVAARCLPSSVDRLNTSEERLSQSLGILLQMSAPSEVDTRSA
jgi:hypothetical protein